MLVSNLAGEIHVVNLTGGQSPQATFFLGSGLQAAAQPTTPEKADEGWVIVLDEDRSYQVGVGGVQRDRVLPRFQGVPTWSGDGRWFFGFDGQRVLRCDPLETCESIGPLGDVTFEGVPRIEVSIDGSRLGVVDTGPDAAPRVRVIELQGLEVQFVEELGDARDLYTRPLCAPSQPILDTQAFATCP